MRLYAGLSRLFPTSYMAKVFVIAFLGTHVPLVVTIICLLSFGGAWLTPWRVFWVMLMATLFSTAGTLMLLNAVMAPLNRIDRSLTAFRREGQILPLPFGYRDQVGRLMDTVNRFVLSVDERLGASRRESETDPLTGLLNRRGFEARFAAQPAPTGAMLMIDADNFKAVNDSLGHAAGDRVLADIGRILGMNIRMGDVLARVGGEEFALFLPRVSSADARDVAERLVRVVEMQVRAGDRPVTVSIGLAMYRPELDLASLLREADRGLYTAKDAGRNRVAVAVVQQGGMLGA
ncbi:GGDEF domain-containing protein [Frigidibacter sp. MR17.24]|uniref:GGDEF domain-containing protein n=1 Tax=Frigidibacter sp. MR17.24 TaxID=3127345 RepID=UPI003012D92C